MTDDSPGYVVMREGIDNEFPFEAGDPVTTYELGDKYPYTSLPPHRGRHATDDAYFEAVATYANQEEHWRVQKHLRCDCKSWRSIARLMVHIPSNRQWVFHNPEDVAKPFRTLVLKERNLAYPLHGAPGEAPHVHGVSSCNGCDKRWLVVSFHDDAEIIHVQGAIHGAKVAP